MKKIIATLAAVAACSFLNASIYYVDMAKVYQNFYKAKEAAAQINASAETTKSELQKMDEKRQALIKEIQPLVEKAKNPALTEAAKKDIIEKEVTPKAQAIQRMETDMRNISEQAKVRLRESAQRIQQVHQALENDHHTEYNQRRLDKKPTAQDHQKPYGDIQNARNVVLVYEDLRDIAAAGLEVGLDELAQISIACGRRGSRRDGR